MPPPLLAIRGKGNNAMIIHEWDPRVQYNESALTSRSIREPPNKLCRMMKFSNAGHIFVYCDGERTIVVETTGLKRVTELDVPKACGFHFSPNDDVLCTIEPYFTSKEFPEGKTNLKIWDTKTWNCLAETKQKSQSFWNPVWFGDGKICGKLMTNNVFFYDEKNFDTVVTKLHIEKLENFSLSSNETPPHRVAAFVRGAKGAPSAVRIFEYPNFQREQVLASKSFFKADTVHMTWNSKGTAILIRAATDVDSTGTSYYGEQSLHYMNSSGDSSIVQLPKKGPIYDVTWDPDGTKFCVTYGFMPAKSSIFNHKCNIVHDFGPSPKNMCVYNPHGNLLLLAGFGNLRGNVEIWHNSPQGIKQVGHLEAPDTTKLEWCPDGEHFITATTTPRLRVNNGYKIWHYGKNVPLVEQKWQNELHEVLWQPFPHAVFPAPKVSVSGSAVQKAVAAAKPQSYVPPHARGRSDYSAAKFKQDEDEVATAEQNLSKSALKNKKKREAKKKQQQQQSQAENSNLSSSQQDAVAMARYLLSDSTPQQPAGVQHNAAGANEVEKKIKNLRKKIQNIEKLKQQQKEGKQLEKNQIEKISTEDDLRAQLQELELS